MSNRLVFECTKLPSNKSGILKPNKDGEYEMLVGGFNISNCNGIYYPANGVEELFKQSSTFMRRIKNGYCKGENGHPEQGTLTDDEYLRRILYIDPNQVAVVHKKIILDYNGYKDENGKPFVGVVSIFQPCGPYGDYLERDLQRNINVAFSLRSIATDKFMNGRPVRWVNAIVTYDPVIEPGIAPCNKFQSSPKLESLMELSPLMTPSRLHGLFINNKGFEAAPTVDMHTIFRMAGYELDQNSTGFNKSMPPWLKLAK